MRSEEEENSTFASKNDDYELIKPFGTEKEPDPGFSQMNLDDYSSEFSSDEDTSSDQDSVKRK